jgi:hypothetical protein
MAIWAMVPNSVARVSWFMILPPRAVKRGCCAFAAGQATMPVKLSRNSRFNTLPM